jgi:hypothetical protein
MSYISIEFDDSVGLERLTSLLKRVDGMSIAGEWLTLQRQLGKSLGLEPNSAPILSAIDAENRYGKTFVIRYQCGEYEMRGKLRPSSLLLSSVDMAPLTEDADCVQRLIRVFAEDNVATELSIG